MSKYRKLGRGLEGEDRNIMNTFGRLLTRYRREKGVAVKDLAQKVGTSVGALNCLCYGHAALPTGFIDLICEALDLDPIAREEIEVTIEENRKHVTTNIRQLTAPQRRFLVQLLRKLPDLTPFSLERLSDVLGKI